MPEQEFWHIVENTCVGENRGKTQVSNLRKNLLTLDANEINGFDLTLGSLVFKSLSDKLWNAAEVILGGCGDDSFIDFRYWLISKGRSIFEKAVDDPDTLADVINDHDIKRGCSFPEFASIAGEAWNKKTGKSFLSRRSGYELFKSPVIPSTLEDIEYKFPKLSARFQNYAYDINTGDQELLEKLQSKLSPERYSAVAILGQTKNKKLIKPILDLLSQLEGDRRRSCVDALAEIGDKNAIPKLIELASNTKEDAKVRYAATSALGRIASELQEATLVKLLEDENREIRGVAATSLGLLGGKNSQLPLITAMSDQNDMVRVKVVGALGNFNSEESILALSENGINDESDQVRGISAAALGHLKAKHTLPELIALLDDDSRFVRDKTVWALVQLKATSAISEIEKTIAKELAGVVKKRMEKSLKKLQKIAS